MFDSFIHFLDDRTPLSAAAGRLLVVVALFAAAWLVSRAGRSVARSLLAWHERRHREAGLEETGKIVNIKRQETLVGIIRAAITYVAFSAAVVLSIAQLLGGVERLTALAGASFALLITAFAAQRVLVDVIAGTVMFLERWYSVGDTVVLQTAYELQGVVEDVSLRRTRLRALNGEVIYVHNSQIAAVRLLPRGVKELVVELFVSDREAGERLVAEVATIVPEGPTTLVRRPWIESVEQLSHDLTRISLRATVTPGREWLVESFLSDLLKERADEGLIVHGPVTLAVDERAARSFARASAATRRKDARARHDEAPSVA